MQATLVAIGIGNTSIRFGVATEFVDGRPRWSSWGDTKTSEFDPQTSAAELPQMHAIWRSASVHRPSEQRLRTWLDNNRPGIDYRPLTCHDLPLEIEVDAPERVGIDRLVAAVAANQLRPAGMHAIVIDAGTAITVDRLSRDGCFQGGAILPGLQTVAHALAARTDLLPEIDANFIGEPPVLGRSTESAMRSGIFWGSLGAVRELVERMRPPAGQPVQVFMTGGDAERLFPLLSQSPGAPETCYVADLVMMGIALAACRS